MTLSTMSSRVDAALAAVLEQAPRLQRVTVMEAEPTQVGYMVLHAIASQPLLQSRQRQTPGRACTTSRGLRCFVSI